MLSVIIPAYNKEKFLGTTTENVREAIAVFHQKYPHPAELIVVNHNSPPRETPAVARPGGRLSPSWMRTIIFHLIFLPSCTRGRLPNLSFLIQEGARSPLASVVPPETATAWSSFLTGKNPGKHGVFGFTARDRPTGRIVPVSALARTGKAFWDLASESGKEVLVLNVPTTYPPHPINGVMISDFITPRGKRDFVYPPALLDELEKRFGPYPLYMRTYFSGNLSEAHAERFLEELAIELRLKFDILEYLMDRFPWDLAVFHLWGTDRVQHDLWNLIDDSHPAYDASLARKCRQRIIEYFEAVDARIVRLRQRLGEDPTLLVISDHGFGPIHKTIDLDVWLLEQGFIRIKKTPVSRLRYLAWKMGLTYERLVRFLLKLLRFGLRLPDLSPPETVNLVRDNRFNPLLSLNDVDWSRTQAYSQMGMGQIVINVEGRTPKGAVKPGEEYRRIRDEIIRRLKERRDPATGLPVGGQVYTKEMIYLGPHLEEAPDITFLPLDNNIMASALMGLRHAGGSSTILSFSATTEWRAFSSPTAGTSAKDTLFKRPG